MSINSTVRILAVDDEDSICTLIRRLVTKQMGFVCDSFTDPEEALKAYKPKFYSCAILDVRMPKMDGLTLMARLHEFEPDLPIVVLTAFGQWESAVNAIRLGAFNFITKPFDNDVVQSVLGHAVQRFQLSKEFGDGDSQVISAHIIGKSEGIRKVLDMIKRVSPTDSTVLISGESGCGKELVARAIHLGSTRRHNSFVPVNCGAFPDSLLESELFGHIKGAFTGADADKIGMFEVANKGTFFLDEVGETSQMIQVKLLRVIETREVRPVGSTQSKKIDTRIIAATNRDLEAEVNANNFRFDLYYRLNVIPIYIPPLRDRKEDIPLLVGSFVSRIARRLNKTLTASSISPAAWDIIEQYPWPGNIRELENVISRAFTLMKSDRVEPEDLGLQTIMTVARVAQGISAETAVKESASQVAESNKHPDTIPKNFSIEKHLEEVEIAYINRAMEMSDGVIADAAQLLDLSIRMLRYKIRKYGIQKNWR